MVKASACGNSDGHRFESKFRQKIIFAKKKFKYEHSALGKGYFRSQATLGKGYFRLGYFGVWLLWARLLSKGYFRTATLGSEVPCSPFWGSARTAPCAQVLTGAHCRARALPAPMY
jgi:hypothetical protein